MPDAEAYDVLALLLQLISLGDIDEGLLTEQLLN